MKYLNSKQIIFHVESLNYKLVYCDDPGHSFFYLSDGNNFISNIKRINAFSAMKKLYKKYGMQKNGFDTIFCKK